MDTIILIFFQISLDYLLDKLNIGVILKQHERTPVSAHRAKWP